VAEATARGVPLVNGHGRRDHRITSDVAATQAPPSAAEVIARAGNRNKYARDLDDALGRIVLHNGSAIKRDGQPWCAVFQAWLYWRSCGRVHRDNGGFHTPTDLAAWPPEKRHTDPEPGDLAYYLRDGTPYHVGLVVAVQGNRYSSIEGNTTTSSAVEANGIGVFQFGPVQESPGDTGARSIGPNVAFARPDYRQMVRTELEEDDMALAWQDGRFKNLFWSQSGIPLSPADVPHATEVVVEPSHDQKLAALCHAAWGVEGKTAEEIIRTAQDAGLLVPVARRTR
jgi:hypothetical protein